MIEKLFDAAKNSKLFNTFVPMPEEIRNTTFPSPTNEELLMKYGASDWYDWSVNNWGTKWDCIGAEGDITGDRKSLTISFDTAWSPPIAFYNVLVEMGFDVEATYTEEGMSFAGHYENGVDECVALDFDKDSQAWIDSMENEVLRHIVQDQFDQWLEWQEKETNMSDDYDDNVDEAQEWHDFDPDC